MGGHNSGENKSGRLESGRANWAWLSASLPIKLTWNEAAFWSEASQDPQAAAGRLKSKKRRKQNELYPMSRLIKYF